MKKINNNETDVWHAQTVSGNEHTKEFCMYCEGTGIAEIEFNGSYAKGKCGCQAKWLDAWQRSGGMDSCVNLAKN